MPKYLYLFFLSVGPVTDTCRVIRYEKFQRISFLRLFEDFHCEEFNSSRDVDTHYSTRLGKRKKDS
jgi:hypothetical protein